MSQPSPNNSERDIVNFIMNGEEDTTRAEVLNLLATPRGHSVYYSK